jgi:L-ascorbate metabolism protein UlaG (beta-lactamase superfamily)
MDDVVDGGWEKYCFERVSASRNLVTTTTWSNNTSGVRWSWSCLFRLEIDHVVPDTGRKPYQCAFRSSGFARPDVLRTHYAGCTDPVFAPSGTEYVHSLITLRLNEDPAISLNALPAVDAVLLSHEDHDDNLDEYARWLLDDRKVITTPDGAKIFSPRSDVRAIRPWQTLDLVARGKEFKVSGIPAVHLPGGEFIQTASFGYAASGLPNAIYLSGDAIYHSDLLKINDKWHVVATILKLGNAQVSVNASKPKEKLQITIGGKDGVRLVKELDAETLIPMHYSYVVEIPTSRARRPLNSMFRASRSDHLNLSFPGLR